MKLELKGKRAKVTIKALHYERTIQFLNWYKAEEWIDQMKDSKGLTEIKIEFV